MVKRDLKSNKCRIFANHPIYTPQPPAILLTTTLSPTFMLGTQR
jgi:hypothetical protein